jgi:ribosomal protein L39E
MAATVKLSCESFMSRLLEDRYCIFLLGETSNTPAFYGGKFPIFRALPLTSAPRKRAARRKIALMTAIVANSAVPGWPRENACRTAATVAAELNIVLVLHFCTLEETFCPSGTTLATR